MSGRPKTAVPDGAVELREAAREVHAAVSDARQVIREMRLLASQLTTETERHLQAEHDELVAALQLRRDQIIAGLAQMVPLRFACPACYMICGILVDLSAEKPVTSRCPECGYTMMLCMIPPGESRA